MKKVIIALAMFTAANNVAFADESGGAVAVSQSSSQSLSLSSSEAAARANNQGNSQNITFTSPPTTTQNVNYSGSYTVKNVPSVNGPNLTTSNDTCMGSSSGSLNIAGFGIGGGSTWVDPNCKMLKNSRELWNMGMKAASLALMCGDPDNRAALELTGFVCPQTAAKNAAAVKSAGVEGSTTVSTIATTTGTTSGVQLSDNEKYTDPFVRSRLGLPALSSSNP
jgi:hypothetical protein